MRKSDGPVHSFPLPFAFPRSMRVQNAKKTGEISPDFKSFARQLANRS
ncbi:hypothetical protein B8V81_3461 [Paenibacillus pasadenensis]|uniref:Uncharacterized protein n=1 Tax=Paenibacillus pasadenensis TaxID=217090 RepID=A0A2N5N3Y5_9BACL|nr:hypothetical protein B8V81_3461 [Paenibacillus pasadenensis]